MTSVVVEVGPNTVRGPGNPLSEWVAVAIECIDDDIALLDEHPVVVADLWHDVLAATIGDHAGPAEQVVVVVPTWWSATRIATATAALERCCADAAVYTRGALLTADTDEVVLEVADDFVLVMSNMTDPVVLDRHTMGLTAHLGGVAEVVLDVPAGVAPLPAEVSADLRAAGVRVKHAGRQRFSRAVAGREPTRAVPRGRRTAAVAGVLAAAAGAGWAVHTAAAPADDGSAWIVEGHVGFRVPAHWTVERITAGSGSARVQVSDPAGAAAVHLTQSQLTAPASTAELSASLRAAIDAEVPGVFVDFDPDGRVGERPAVTYREVRTHSHTRWAVVIDGTTSIAVGCQSVSADLGALQEICARAVESARVVD